MAKIILSILASLTIILLTVQSPRAQAYKWIDDQGNMHFTYDSGQIPEKYKDRMKKQNEWEEKSREQNKSEARRNREETRQQKVNEEEAVQEDEAVQANDPEEYIDICEERERHIRKAQELFPNEEIGKAFDKYRQQYMTEEERNLIPERISTDQNDPCHF